MKVPYDIYNLKLFHNYNKEKRGLKILGWMRWNGENSNVITSMDLESRDVGGHSLIEGVRYKIEHKVPVSYFFIEEDGLVVYDVAEVEGTLSLEHFFAGPELLEAKLSLVNQKDLSKRVEAQSNRTFLVLCLEDKIESIRD